MLHVYKWRVTLLKSDHPFIYKYIKKINIAYVTNLIDTKFLFNNVGSIELSVLCIVKDSPAFFKHVTFSIDLTNVTSNDKFICSVYT